MSKHNLPAGRQVSKHAKITNEKSQNANKFQILKTKDIA